MSLIKKLAGETALYGLSSIVARFLNTLLVPLYTNTLGKAEYGVVLQFYAYSGFLMVLYSYRMESAFFRFGSAPEDRQKAYTTSIYSILISTAVLATGIFLCSGSIASVIQYPLHPEYVRYFGLMLAFDCLAELPFARLRLEQRPIKFVFVKFCNIGTNVILTVFWLLFCPWAAANGYDWVYAVWSPSLGVSYIFIANVLASAVTILLLLPELGKAFKGQFDGALWRKMMVYAGPLIIVNFAGIINEMLDRALLPYLVPGTPTEGLAQLGVYGANYKLAMLITLFNQAYRYAAEPFFFKTAGDADALQTQANATKWFTLAASVGMLTILLFLDIIKYFIGKDFHGALNIVPILLLANVLLGIYYNFSVWYRLKDRTGTGAIISVAGALLTVALLFWWVPMMGYIGAAWATLVCYAFMSTATWLTGRRIHPVPYQLGRMAGYIGVALGFYLLSEWLKLSLHGQAAWLLWLVRTGLLGVYLGAIYKLEGKDLRKA